MNYDIPINEELTSLALAFNNNKFIADAVLPRVPVTTETFKYLYYPEEQFLTVPDTTIGPKGEANTVDLNAEFRTASVKARALKEIVPRAKIDAAVKNGQKNPMDKATVQLTKIIQLSREVDTARLLSDANNYGYSLALSGTDCINDPSSDVLNIIQDTIDNMPLAPTTMVMSRKVASALRRNASIVKGYHGNSGDKGMVPLEFIKDLFGFQDIFVGESVMNSSKKGHQAQLVGVWGNFISMFYADATADTEAGMTFGITAEYEKRTARNWTEEGKGIKGGEVIQIHEQETEIITAPQCGALLYNVLKVG